MATKKGSGPAITKKRIASGFTIPGNTKKGRQTQVVKEGDEITAKMRKDWEEWQKEANSEGSIPITNYS